MTADEWLACTQPRAMLPVLADMVSKRKLRLFACACCRRVWDLLPDARSRRAVEVAERFADRLATDAERAAAWSAAAAVEADALYRADYRTAAAHARCVAAAATAGFANDAAAYAIADYTATAPQVQCDLLRDLFGNPFRPVSLDPHWLWWGGGVVRELAQEIYDTRRFDGLALMADVLVEAGCTDPDVLSHCRSGQGHIRGCWLVDLLLGKECGAGKARPHPERIAWRPANSF
jgi:hypothetical protein